MHLHVLRYLRYVQMLWRIYVLKSDGCLGPPLVPSVADKAMKTAAYRFQGHRKQCLSPKRAQSHVGDFLAINVHVCDEGIFLIAASRWTRTGLLSSFGPLSQWRWRQSLCIWPGIMCHGRRCPLLLSGSISFCECTCLWRILTEMHPLWKR